MTLPILLDHSGHIPALFVTEGKACAVARSIASGVPETIVAALTAFAHPAISSICTYLVIFNVKINNSEIFLDYANE